MVTSTATAFDVRSNSTEMKSSDEVFIMENNPQWQSDIAKFLHKYGLKPRVVSNVEEAVLFAERGAARCFILDIFMGVGRNQEGLDTLERLKNISQSIFVAIYSSYPDKLEQAQRLGADALRMKSADIGDDVRAMLSEMLASHLKNSAPHLQGLASRIANDPIDPPKLIEQGGNLKFREPDKNQAFYDKLRSDPGWLEKHHGSYVAIIDGELVGEDTDRRRLLDKVRKKYADTGKRIYFTQVEEQEEIIRIHTPFFVKEE